MQVVKNYRTKISWQQKTNVDEITFEFSYVAKYKDFILLIVY